MPTNIDAINFCHPPFLSQPSHEEGATFSVHGVGKPVIKRLRQFSFLENFSAKKEKIHESANALQEKPSSSQTVDAALSILSLRKLSKKNRPTMSVELRPCYAKKLMTLVIIT